MDAKPVHRWKSANSTSRFWTCPTLTPQAVMVVLFESLLETNEPHGGDQLPSDRQHRPGRLPSSPLDLWASATDSMPAPMVVALRAGWSVCAALLERKPAGRGSLGQSGCGGHSAARGVELEAARLVSGNIGSRRRHGGGGGDAPAMAAGGAQCADCGEATGAIGRGESAAACLGFRYAGPGPGPASPDEPRCRTWMRHWHWLAASTRQTAST
jgi:hypothetical protein